MDDKERYLILTKQYSRDMEKVQAEIAELVEALGEYVRADDCGVCVPALTTKHARELIAKHKGKN